MHDATHALSVIGTSIGLPSLAFNERRQAQIKLSQTRSIYFTEITPKILEVTVMIPGLKQISEHLKLAMLMANSHETVPGRLALDPVTGDAMYGERWFVTAMPAEQVEQNYRRVSDASLTWESAGLDALKARAEQIQESYASSVENLLHSTADDVSVDPEGEDDLYDADERDDAADDLKMPDMPFIVRV